MYEKQTVIVYSAEASNRSLFMHLGDILRELPRAHELGWRLFKRNLTALYRQSFLGFGWALLPPLATAALWIFLRGSNVVTLEDAGVPYPVFVLTGAMLWQIFSESILAPLNQVVQNKAMISKINIPREGLLLSGAYELVFNILVKCLLLAVVFIFFRQPVDLAGLFFVPAGIFAIGLAGFSIGLGLAPMGMLYQDIGRGITILMPFLMYLTPVVYPIPQDGSFATLMRLNPLSILITQTRNGFTAQPLGDLGGFFVTLLVFAALFFAALVTYRLSMPMIIERIGS